MRDIVGFSDFLYYAKNSYQSTGFINTTGFQYILLDINGYDTITHISQDNEFKIFAKIPLTVSKNFITIGNITSINTRPKLFDTPENIPQIRVRIMDVLGNILDLNKQNISMTFEVEYFRTQKAYDKARNTLLPEGELTSFSAAGTRTTAQVEKKERLRNIVFKQ
jgi:hypothetical protein